MQAYLFVLISIVLGAVGQVLMKLGATKLNPADSKTLAATLLNMFMQPFIIEGLILLCFVCCVLDFRLATPPAFTSVSDGRCWICHCVYFSRTTI